MLFAILCDDKPDGGLALRLATRPKHVEWLNSLGTSLKFAGPFMDDGGTEMRGSLIVIEADNIEAARALSQQDPFYKAGVFESSNVRAWNWTINKPEGV